MQLIANNHVEQERNLMKVSWLSLIWKATTIPLDVW